MQSRSSGECMSTPSPSRLHLFSHCRKEIFHRTDAAKRYHCTGEERNLWNTIQWDEGYFGQRIGRKVKYETEEIWNNYGFSWKEIVTSFAHKCMTYVFNSVFWYHLKVVACPHKMPGINRAFLEKHIFFRCRSFVRLVMTGLFGLDTQNSRDGKVICYLNLISYIHQLHKEWNSKANKM